MCVDFFGGTIFFNHLLDSDPAQTAQHNKNSREATLLPLGWGGWPSLCTPPQGAKAVGVAQGARASWVRRLVGSLSAT